MRAIKETHGSGSEPIVVVGPRSSRRSQSRPLDSVTASIIVQARHHWQQRTRVAVERAVEYFSRAVGRDARAIEAWCGLADAWTVMGGRGYAPVESAAARAAEYAERALAFDDTQSAAHASLGGVNILRRRWHEAESELRCAIQIDPCNADAHHWLALTLLTGFGKRDEALREQTIAARTNPLAPIQVGALGWQQYLRGDYELSKLALEPAADLNGELEEAHAGVARAAARLGDEAGVRSAITAALNRRLDLRGDLLAEQASALAVLGETRRARRVATEAAAHGAEPLNLALAWATQGDANRAFAWLRRGSFSLYWAPQAIWWDRRFDASERRSRTPTRFATGPGSTRFTHVRTSHCSHGPASGSSGAAFVSGARRADGGDAVVAVRVTDTTRVQFNDQNSIQHLALARRIHGWAQPEPRSPARRWRNAAPRLGFRARGVPEVPRQNRRRGERQHANDR
jgi:hypothetical protein